MTQALLIALLVAQPDAGVRPVELAPAAIGATVSGQGVVLAAPDAGPPPSTVTALPVGAPAYTPELGFLLAGGGAVSWGEPGEPRSSFTAVAGYGTVGAFLAQARLAAFFKRDTVRLTAPLEVREMPDHYFGKGWVAAHDTPQGEQTAYRRAWWQVAPQLLVRAGGAIFIGGAADFSQTHAYALSAGVANDATFRRAGPDVYNAGLGLTVQLDTRDVPINAWSGTFLSVTWLGYGPWFGARSQFSSLSVDYRQYVTLGFDGSTLSWQVKYRTVFGDAPWSELSLLGSPWELRAYRWGQYRDVTAMSAVVEYRLMVPSRHWFWGRNGFVAWVGAGALGGDALPDVTRPVPAVGLGYRLHLFDRITLRLDVGFGDRSRAVYFNFLEAF